MKLVLALTIILTGISVFAETSGQLICASYSADYGAPVDEHEKIQELSFEESINENGSLDDLVIKEYLNFTWVFDVLFGKSIYISAGPSNRSHTYTSAADNSIYFSFQDPELGSFKRIYTRCKITN